MGEGIASPSRGRWREILLKLLFSLGILAVFVIVVDRKTVMQLVGKAHPGFLFLLLVIAMARMGIAAIRLRLLIGQRAPIALAELTRQYFIGAYFNNLLPTSIGGDAARIVLLGRSGLSKSEGAVYVLIERLLGIASLVILTLVGVFLVPVMEELRVGAMGLAGLSAAGAGVCLLGRRRLRAMELPNSALGRAIGAGRDLLDQPSLLGLSLLASITFQLASVALSYVTAVAMGIELSFSACLALVPLVWLITMLPLSIGGIGLREAAYALLLGTVGISTEESLLVSLGTYAALLVTGAVGGIILIRDDTARLFLGRGRSPGPVVESDSHGTGDDEKANGEADGA